MLENVYGHDAAVGADLASEQHMGESHHLGREAGAVRAPPTAILHAISVALPPAQSASLAVSSPTSGQAP